MPSLSKFKNVSHGLYPQRTFTLSFSDKSAEFIPWSTATSIALVLLFLTSPFIFWFVTFHPWNEVLVLFSFLLLFYRIHVLINFLCSSKQLQGTSPTFFGAFCLLFVVFYFSCSLSSVLCLLCSFTSSLHFIRLQNACLVTMLLLFILLRLQMESSPQFFLLLW